VLRSAAILPIPMAKEWAPKAGALFGMHLALADKILEDGDYRDAYAAAVARGEYVILDNGAAENGASLSGADLLEAARLINAQEIVAPDVLEDSEATIHLTHEFLEGVGEQLQESNIRLMFVPQGKTGYEWQVCLQTMISMVKSLGLGKRIIIGVPKHLDKKVTGGRAEVLSALASGWQIPYKFHMLGSGEYLCRDVAMAKRYVKWIRSIDSSLPTAMAQKGVRLGPAVGRNGALCDFHKDCDPVLLGRNMLELKKWVTKRYSCQMASNSNSGDALCRSCRSGMK
jgi:hypothetical protein